MNHCRSLCARDLISYPIQCQYPEPIRLPWEASSSKSPAQQSTSPKPNASLLSLISEVDTRLAEIEHDLPEVKAYYAYKGYDQSSEQATTVAFMSALLRDTKVARYFFGGEEPWVVLRDLVDGDVELRCVSRLSVRNVKLIRVMSRSVTLSTIRSPFSSSTNKTTLGSTSSSISSSLRERNSHGRPQRSKSSSSNSEPLTLRSKPRISCRILLMCH